MQVRDFDGTWERWDLVENHNREIGITVSGWRAEDQWFQYKFSGMTK